MYLTTTPVMDLLSIPLVRNHSQFSAPPLPPPRRGLAVWQVRRVTDYIGDHLDEDLRLSELATLIGLSRFHFCTAFRLATGHTPHEWLVTERIRRAREMLSNPVLRITDIALAVGYQTPSAFTASFRKIVGLTPSQFRRELLTSQPGSKSSWTLQLAGRPSSPAARAASAPPSRSGFPGTASM